SSLSSSRSELGVTGVDGPWWSECSLLIDGSTVTAEGSISGAVRVLAMAEPATTMVPIKATMPARGAKRLTGEALDSFSGSKAELFGVCGASDMIKTFFQKFWSKSITFKLPAEEVNSTCLVVEHL